MKKKNYYLKRYLKKKQGRKKKWIIKMLLENWKKNKRNKSQKT